VRARWRRTRLVLVSAVIVPLVAAGAVLAWMRTCRGDGDARDVLYPVLVDEGWGFIDAGANMVVGPVFDGAGDFFEGRARVKAGARWGYVDRGGRLVVEPLFDEAADFSEGRAAVRSGAKWGYVGSRGEVVVEPRFIDAGAYGDGLAPVEVQGRQDESWGYVDESGRLVIGPRFAFAGRFVDGLARVEICPGRDHEPCVWHYVDTRGEQAFEGRFDWARDFSEGLARVMVGGRWGYVDESGRFAVEPRYARAGDFSGGLARVRTGGLWGFIDGTGTQRIAPRFALVGDFHGRAAAVMYVESYEPGTDEPIVRDTGYVDREGDFIWNTPDGGIVRRPPDWDPDIVDFDFLTGDIRVIGSFDPSTYELKFREQGGAYTTVVLDLPSPFELGRVRGVLPGETTTLIVTDETVVVTLGWASMLAGETTLLMMRVGGEQVVQTAAVTELTQDARGDELLSWTMGPRRLYLLTRSGKIKHRELSDTTGGMHEHILETPPVGPAALHFAGGRLFVFQQDPRYVVVEPGPGRWSEHTLKLGFVPESPPVVEEVPGGLAVTSGDQRATIGLEEVERALSGPATESQ
jgi:hypothetical protein